MSFLDHLPLVNLVGVVSLGKPGVGAVVSVEIVFLVFFILSYVVIVAFKDILAVESAFLEIFKFFLGHQGLVKGGEAHFLAAAMTITALVVFASVAAAIAVRALGFWISSAPGATSLILLPPVILRLAS